MRSLHMHGLNSLLSCKALHGCNSEQTGGLTYPAYQQANVSPMAEKNVSYEHYDAAEKNTTSPVSLTL